MIETTPMQLKNKNFTIKETKREKEIRDLRQRKEGEMDMERNLRYRKLIAFTAIALILLPFALCLVNNSQAETTKFICF